MAPNPDWLSTAISTLGSIVLLYIKRRRRVGRHTSLQSTLKTHTQQIKELLDWKLEVQGVLSSRDSTRLL